MKKKCLLIPGNPAVADFYLSWIKEIQDSCPNIDITYATSYILFDRKLNYVQYDAAMQKYYEELFNAIKTEEKITLLAHSVGSYFALNLLEKYPDKVEQVIVLFPYLGFTSAKIFEFASIPYCIDRIFPLAEAVSGCKNLFKKWNKNVQYISKLELTANLRYGFRQCTYFSKHKFVFSNLLPFKDKICFIFTENDHWCPSETINALKPFSNSRQVNLSHDFILDESSRLAMIDVIKPYLTKLL